MDENGMNHRLTLKWLPKIEDKASIEPALSLGYDNVLLPFLALVLGGMLSILAALLEISTLLIHKLRFKYTVKLKYYRK